MDRVVVIGDLHGDLDAARAAFRLAGAIDDEDRWIGGGMTVVQLGDLIGRSHQEREVLDFVFAVRERAEAAGGVVSVVLGNHEIFGARLELRWVDERAYAAFDEIGGLDRTHPRVVDLPPDRRARAAALLPGGPYARLLAELPAVLRRRETIFVHGGVTPHWAEYGIDRINDEIRRWLSGEGQEPNSARGMDPGEVDDIVMMSRHFSQDVDPSDCALLDQSLSILGAARMVVAHSVQDSITSRCDGRVWAVDVGMSRSYGGPTQVLQIEDDRFVSVLGSPRGR